MVKTDSGESHTADKVGQLIFSLDHLLSIYTKNNLFEILKKKFALMRSYLMHFLFWLINGEIKCLITAL